MSSPLSSCRAYLSDLARRVSQGEPVLDDDLKPLISYVERQSHDLTSEPVCYQLCLLVRDLKPDYAFPQYAEALMTKCKTASEVSTSLVPDESWNVATFHEGPAIFENADHIGQLWSPLEIPAEISRIIFASLQMEDIRQCRLVCKDFHNAVAYRFNEKLNIHNTPADLARCYKWSKCLQPFVNTISIDLTHPPRAKLWQFSSSTWTPSSQLAVEVTQVTSMLAEKRRYKGTDDIRRNGIKHLLEKFDPKEIRLYCRRPYLDQHYLDNVLRKMQLKPVQKLLLRDIPYHTLDPVTFDDTVFTVIMASCEDSKIRFGSKFGPRRTRRAQSSRQAHVLWAELTAAEGFPCSTSFALHGPTYSVEAVSYTANRSFILFKGVSNPKIIHKPGRCQRTVGGHKEHGRRI